MMSSTLITIVVVWLLILATVWLGFVIVQRYFYFKTRSQERQERISKLGAALNEQDDFSVSDRKEALNERIAKMRGQH